MLQGVHRGDDGHVHDVVYLRAALQHMHRLGHADENGPDRLRAPDPVEQLVGDVRGIQVRKNQHVRRAPQAREWVRLLQDSFHHGRVRLHLTVRLQCRLALVQQAHRLLHLDRKSTRLNSSHSQISYAVFCLKKKNKIFGSKDRMNAISSSASHHCVRLRLLPSRRLRCSMNTSVLSSLAARWNRSLYLALPPL